MPRHALASLVRLAVHTLVSQRGTVAVSLVLRRKRETAEKEKKKTNKMRSPLKPSSVGPSRATVAPARAMLFPSAAAPVLASARNGAVAQATASSSCNNGAAAIVATAQRRRRRRRIASFPSFPLLSSSYRDAAAAALSPLRALPTATSPSSEASSPRQRSPKVTTTSSAVPAPPSLQQQRGASSPSTLLNNRAPLPAPPADGAPLAHEIIKGSMVSDSLWWRR